MPIFKLSCRAGPLWAATLALGLGSAAWPAQGQTAPSPGATGGLTQPPGMAGPGSSSVPSLLSATDPEAAFLGWSDGNPALPASLLPPDPTAVSNYGKPKPKKPVLYAPEHKVVAPLLPLVPYPTAPGGQTRKGASTDDTPPPPAPTTAALPRLPAPRKLPVDTNPFSPIGVRASTFVVKPFVETSLGYDTNPNRQSGGIVSSPFVQTRGGLGVASDWSQHSLTADLGGGYTRYFRLPIADHPDANAVVDGRIDVTRDLKINLESRFGLATETPGSPQLAVPGSTFIINRPSILSYGSSVGIRQTFNRLSIELKSTIDRLVFNDATLSDGTTLALSTTNYNAYGLTPRVSYELTPGFIPYAELTGDTRKHDDHFDFNGYARDSKGVSGRLGSTFEISRILTGDLAAGYADRHYVDPRLPDLQGPTVYGSLTWSVTPLTTVTAKTGTYLSETTQVATSGAIGRTVSLQVAHALLRNLTLTGVVSYTNNTYQGQPIVENYIIGQLKADYNVTRDIMLRASYSHERVASSLAGASFSADVVQLGVRLQR